MTAWEAARGEGDNVPVAAARSGVTPCFSPSPGIFKQLDPENTGTIQLDLISVSTPPLAPTWTGEGGCLGTYGWLTCCLKALFCWGQACEWV